MTAAVQVHSNGFSNFWNDVGRGFKIAIKDISGAFGDTQTLQSIARLAINIFHTIGLMTGVSTAVSVVSKLLATEKVIDVFQVFDPIGYLGNIKKFTKEKLFNITGQIALLGAGILGGVSFLAEAGLINLGKAAGLIGAIGSGLVAVGFTLFAADAIRRIVKADQSHHRNQAILDLAFSVSVIGIKALALSGVGLFPGMLILGTASAILGIVNFLHRQHVKREDAELKRQQELNV